MKLKDAVKIIMGEKKYLYILGGVFLLIGVLVWFTLYEDRPKKEASGSYCEKMLSRASIPAVLPVYTGKGKVDFNTDPNAWLFKTKISEAVAYGANYAGEYTVASWGCGTSCQQSAVIDIKTGQIVAFNIPSEFGTKFDKTSRILITNPKEMMPKRENMNISEEEYNQIYARSAREYYAVLESASMKTSYLEKLCTENALSN